MMNKKVFSLNLQAFIMTFTDLKPEVVYDDIMEEHAMVFPEVAAVQMAIDTYRLGSPVVRLHDFLAAIRYIKKQFKYNRQAGSEKDGKD